MSDSFILNVDTASKGFIINADKLNDSFILNADGSDEYLMWQGRIGPYYTPSVDNEGNLSWTNNGGLANPATVNIMGKGLNIVGIVEDVSDLPESTDDFDVYLVGASDPYTGYMYYEEDWVNLGIIGRGEAAGFGTPTASIDANTGTPSVTVTASGPDTAKVFNFEFHNLRGQDAEGQPGTATPLVDSPSGAVGTSTDFAREDHSHPMLTSSIIPPRDQGTGSAGTNSNYYARVNHCHPLNVRSLNPKMDGTASYGSSSYYSRDDHVHPSDTSRAALTLIAPAYSSSSTYDIGDYCTRNSILYICITAISTPESFTSSHWSTIDSIAEVIANKVLYLTDVACIATTGDFATVSDSRITADHVVAECIFAIPSYITTDVTWTTASGSLVLNGTCSTATTANIVLVKKDN